MGPNSGERFVVVTGGPGAGKTTLLDELHNRGFAVAPEAARAIIKQQQRIGGRGLETVDPQLLIELVLSWEIRSYLAAEQSGRLTFFDRSLVELPAWYRALGRPVPPYVDEAVRLFRYGTTVFHAPAWREIYTNDAERTQSWAHAERVSGPSRAGYVDAGYDVVTLPLASPQERADFVLETLRAG
jgi:predicted ATPase